MDKSQQPSRIAFLDFTRAITCFMVIVVHTCEFFYVGDITLFTDKEVFWAALIDSALRVSVPIFVMMSSYLLLPLKDDLEIFLKRRLTRVVIPFIVWSLAYATLPVLWGALDADGVKENLLRLTYNFNMASGHLWYIYMFIGLYLFMPIISPWLQSAKRRHIEYFLALWFISTFHHYATYFIGTEDGLYGECYWNEFHSLWYFSGHIGYIVLAYYIREYINFTAKKSLLIGIPLFLTGWAIAYYSFASLYSSNDIYTMELGWRFCSPNVAIATFALFIMFKCIRCKNQVVLRVVEDVSRLCYGIYLAHIFILNTMYNLLNSHIDAIPLKIGAISITTYIATYLLVKILSYLPKGKYIVG